MTASDFQRLWDAVSPKTAPVSHNLKYAYPDRWFRIHSLPGSKRYAETPEERNILLCRQNALMADLLGNGEPAVLVTGDFCFPSPAAAHMTIRDPLFRFYAFTQLEPIDLHASYPEEFEPGLLYRPVFAETIWSPHRHDPLLMGIADDTLRALFVSPGSYAVVAPYDGGIDCLLKDTATRDAYKAKYQQWLSPRDDGL